MEKEPEINDVPKDGNARDGNAIFGIPKSDGGAGGKPSPLAFAFELNKQIVGKTRETLGRNVVADTLLKGATSLIEAGMGFVDKVVESRKPIKFRQVAPEEATEIAKFLSEAIQSGRVGKGPSIF